MIETLLIALAIVILAGNWHYIKKCLKTAPELPGDFDEAIIQPGDILEFEGWKGKLENYPKVTSYYNEKYSSYTIRLIDNDHIVILYLGQEIAHLKGDDVLELAQQAIDIVHDQTEAQFE